jgi:hypothetical protein
MKIENYDLRYFKINELLYRKKDYIASYKDVLSDENGSFLGPNNKAVVVIKEKYTSEVVLSCEVEKITNGSNVFYTDLQSLISDLETILDDNTNTSIGPTGPTGPQGPVGPAGLNWMGEFVLGNSYSVNDAVGFDGASWFCIVEIDPSSDNPDVDTAHWALLASQGAVGPTGATGATGATGPQGPQGPVGSLVKTKGLVYGGTYPNNETVLPYDINVINAGTGNLFKLPNNASLGTEIIVDCAAPSATVYTFSGGGIETAVNGQAGQRNVSFNEIVKFTSYANNYWLAETIQRNTPSIEGRDLSNGTNWLLTWGSNTTTPLSLSTLNSTFNNNTTLNGFQVFCPSITGGGLVYTKTGVATWVSQPITVVS